ncbi:MAG: hypothetical protein JSR17_03140 [Proteobacteria bacterium]|nr:hypothetical protein [Pseudomonadota bacterium]
MSGVLHKLKHFKRELKHFSFAEITNEIQRINDQFALISLKRILKDVVEESEDDFEISYDELEAIQLNCKNFHDQNLNKIAQALMTYCRSVVTERNTLLQNLLEFIYNCQLISDPALIDYSKVDPKIIAICKKLYNTDDMTTYLHDKKIEILLEGIAKFPFFSQEQFQKLTEQCQQSFEKKLSLLIARKQASAKPVSFPAFLPSFAEKMQTLSSKLQMAPSSAPTSPTKADTDKGVRSRSVPNSAKAKTATERLTSFPPERGRSSSHTIYAVPAQQKDETESTASTVLMAESGLADDFFHLTLGPSSRSEDDSDEKKRQEEKVLKRALSKKK